MKKFKQARVKIYITINVQMPEKMRAALNQISCNVKKTRVGKALTKNLCLLKIIDDLLFLRFSYNEYFEGRPGANAFKAFLLDTVLLGSTGYFLQLKTFC